LLNGANYYVNIPSSAITDMEGNAFAGITGSTAFTFSTVAAADTTGPLVTTKTPASGATEVDIESTLSVSFNEAIQAGTGSITLVNTGNASDNRIIDITDTAQVTFSGTTVNINPEAELANDSTYQVNIPSTAITDTAGNAFAGINGATEFNFTTEAGLTPAGVSQAQGSGQQITLTFDSALNTTSIPNVSAFSGTKTIGGTPTALVFQSISLSGSTATLTLANALESQATVVLNYTPPGTNPIKDTAGTPVAAITNLNVPVATGDTTPPVLTSRSPSTGETEVLVASPVVFTFNETVMAGTGTVVLTNSMDPGDTRTINITDNTQVTISANTVTIQPTNELAGNATYTVTMTSGAVQDSAGNAFAGLSAGDGYSFTTAHAWAGGDWLDQGEL
jgi:methionine-rich copper-binding protein CopC